MEEPKTAKEVQDEIFIAWQTNAPMSQSEKMKMLSQLRAAERHDAVFRIQEEIWSVHQQNDEHDDFDRDGLMAILEQEANRPVD
jgi:hypothetical protein